MTHCERTRELIGPYVDDSLPSESRRRVEDHLLGCRDCAWEAQSQRITRDRLREGMGEVVASDAFRARVLARARQDNPHVTVVSEETPEPTQIRLPIGL